MVARLPPRNCLTCGKEYIPPREKSSYCSHSCRSTGTNTARKHPPVTISCVVCGKEFEVPYTARNSRKTCSGQGGPCARALAETKFDKKEVARRISKTRLDGFASGRLVHVGVPHTEETKKVLSEKAKARFSVPENNPMFGRKHSERSREQQSRTRVLNILAGKYGGWFRKGVLQTKKGGEVSFRSTWEETVALMLDADENVLAFKHEPFSIPYSKEADYESIRRYIPDFLVQYTDGRKVLVEIKPKCFVGAAVNVAKFSAAREHCFKHDMTFEVWTQDKLGTSVSRPSLR